MKPLHVALGAARGATHRSRAEQNTRTITTGWARASTSGKATPERALQFARERAAGGHNSRGKIKKPSVLGAVLNLKRCLDLADSSAIAQLKQAHRNLEELSTLSGVSLPRNTGGLRARKLDCVVINSLHETRLDDGLPSYDTVRGLFWEGSPICEGAGVSEFNHIQLCVRDVSCILGYFRPIELEE